MGRAILGAVLGYAASVAVVIACLALAWTLLGAEGSFAGEGPYPSAAWVIFALAGGFVGAYVAGMLAAKVGRGLLAVKILIGLMMVLGLWAALAAESSYAKRSANAPDKAIADLTFMEAGAVAKSPTWYNWVIPFVGVTGVLLGGRERD